MTPIETPVAYLAYNRPKHVARTFEAIRSARPAMLFLIADGPKPGSETDAAKCLQVREILESIDWPCKVFRNYAEQNLGLKVRVSSGLDWVFSHVDRAIILEDDCLPHPDFFRFCETLLSRYEADERVWAVTGDNFQKGHKRGNASYYFSKYPHCWGWATWKKNWKKYDSNLSFWQKYKSSKRWSTINAGQREQSYWESIFDNVERGLVNSWAFPWTASVWERGGLTATPNVNLVSNIGFGPDGTNCLEPMDHYGEINETLGDAIIHPEEVVRNIQADIFAFENHFNPPQEVQSLNHSACKGLLGCLKKYLSKPDKKRQDGEKKKIISLGFDHQRLLSIPRYSETTVEFGGRPFIIPDTVSCYYAYKEIFEKEIYKFNSTNATPRIVDCGSNIGLSVLYFKKLYPNATITAVEADARIFTYLCKNVESFQDNSLKLIQKAVSSTDGEIMFSHEGADAGREVMIEEENSDFTTVTSCQLDHLIQDQVDFLKMDIEGAEVDTLLASRLLCNVKNLFVEYHSFSEQKQRLPELLDKLTREGFRYYISTVYSPENAYLKQETQSGMDLQLNIFCVRPSKSEN